MYQRYKRKQRIKNSKVKTARDIIPFKIGTREQKELTNVKEFFISPNSGVHNITRIIL